MTSSTPAHPARRLRLAAALIGIALSLGACMHDPETPETAMPNDYRQRHPIAIREADRTVVIFVGNARGGLTAPQRADVADLAQSWLREGTGAMIAEVPTDTPNARTAAETMRQIQSLLSAAGVPPRGVMVRNYRPDDPRQFAPIRLIYPKITAVAGPCGQWPDDLGPSIKNKAYLENKQYYNLGCSNQHNLAAMIDNPADLVQPRPEAPAYAARRTTTFKTYREAVPEVTKSTISEVAK